MSHEIAQIVSLLFKIGEVNERAKRFATIQRTIQAPDGRVATFLVRKTEPATVTIARMYPSAVVPVDYRYLTDGTPARQVQTQVPLSPGDRELTKKSGKFARNTVLCVGGALLLLGILAIIGNQNQPTHNTTYAATTAPRVTGTEVLTSPSSGAAAAEPSATRVRLKTDGNIRSGPSRQNQVIRIGRRGDILSVYVAANGWLQVGQAAPEGWIAESVITRLVP